LAGERAITRRAYREAEQHYRDALAILQTLPESEERDARELSLQVALGNVMGLTRGYSAAETAEAYERAKALAERGGGADSFQVFNGLRTTAFSRGEHRAALALADRMLDIASGIGSPQSFFVARFAQGLPRHYLGDLAGAGQHLLLAMEQYREGDFRGAFDDVGVYGVYSLCYLGHNEWHLGHPDRALHYVNEAIALARDLNNPFAIAVAVTGDCQICTLRKDFERVIQTSEETLRLNATLQFPLWNAIGKIHNAWARAQLGDATGAVERIPEGTAEFDTMKLYLGRAWALSMLVEAQALAGSVDDALVTLEQALQPNPDELIYRPLALTLRGDLRLRSDSKGKAHFELGEQDFREAIELSRGMSARSLELRATTSLARLLAKQGLRAEARAMLAEIYQWFTEGFDSLDLGEAKALLDELTSVPSQSP
jgi:tetratricopeptide (TPR) repeat protein